ncbi:MAG TPA: helix-turn-helix domain-containing protein [Gemmatimonadales bacterium]|jgi:DNA-binding MarR family transcriptional regulator
MTDTDYHTMASFRQALRRFFAFSEETLHAVGLTPQQYQALLAIRAHSGADEMTVGTLATRLFIRHHSAVGLVDRLEARGFVERQPVAHDRRLVCLALTLSGSKALGALAATHRAELMRLRPEVISLLESLG